MITAPDVALVAGAGVLAGIVGTAGGITSLISYPALLAAGVPALRANVANIVALVACWPGSALASRPELEGQGAWVRRWVWVTAAGGAVGAVLLLSTPQGAFSVIVPFLVAAGSLALLFQPRNSAMRSRDRNRGNGYFLFAGLLSVSVYSGYFGAGSGVMTLGLLLHAVERRIASANALKNMLIGGTAVTSALVFAAFAPVDWAVVVPLGLGMFAGSVIGPRAARRIPAAALRWMVAFLGIGLAVKLWIAPT
ncbi:MAG: sulfite exporter TauE/SafE family protein [Streptosporangiaceae bacterium]